MSSAAKSKGRRPSGKTRQAGGKAEIAFAPRQARSRESERRLLKAAAEVLGQHGVEGATIPRIAAHAGLTPGSIYRRFPDKEVLLETVILGILERQDERMRTGMTTEMTAQIPLPVFTEQIVHSLLVSYRANAGLMRAMQQFARASANQEFRRKVTRLEIRTFERLVDLFLAAAKNIGHPEPRMAIALGLTMVISTLHECVLHTTDPKAWKTLLPQDDPALRRELTRAFLRYLGAP
ncbi:MAG TPA: TetR/AcrR family transcriptional regulator [Myxococcales bacterium]|nr:TetR/AcrR family transcriptional regulator [Myxococcales bacterium]